MFLKLVTDMSEKYRQTLFFLSFLVLFSLYGCFNSKPVRHLSSDVCLLIPNMTTKEEVLRLIGQPNQRLTSQQGQETWYYYNAKKSLLRKTPYVGDKLGNENFDLVTVTFTGDRVVTCVYRALTQEEFEKTGINENPDSTQ